MAPVPLVVAAPSGAGKTSVLRALLAQDDRLVFSVSHTTRPPRASEREGVDYHFVSPEEFERLVEKGAFVEWAEYAGNRYGTTRESLERELARGLDVVLEVEVQGAAQLRARRSDAVLVFLLPPSLEALEARLRGRGTDAEDVIRRRLGIARRELAEAPHFHYGVVNDRLEDAVADFREIVSALRRGERQRLAARFGIEGVLQRWHRQADPA